MKRLISVPELFEIINNKKNVVILDCRFDLINKSYGPDAYKKGHIKGAYLIDLEKYLTDPKSEHGGRHPFKNISQLKTILERFGVSDDSIVIAYDDGDMQGAGRLVFQLNNLGFYNAFALDGGLLAYKNLGGEVETEENIPNFSNCKLTVREDTSFIVDKDYVKSKLYDENTIIIDSRSKNRYLGLEEPVDPVAGHIPSAKSYFFQNVLNIEEMDKPSFRSSFMKKDFLENHFKDLDPQKEIIIYCGSGISLMVNALALDIAEIPYKIYPGSYSDWISYEDNDVKIGEEK